MELVRISKNPAERRKEILLASRTLFFKKGFHETSVKDIVGELGVAQGLFYYYFKSKEAVFNAVIEDYADEYIERIQGCLFAEEKSLPERIIMALKMFVQLERQGDSIFLDELHAPEHIELHDKVSMHVVEELWAPVRQLLTIENEKGTLHVEDIMTTTTYLLYGIYGVLHKGLNHNEIATVGPSLVHLISTTLQIPADEFLKAGYFDAI